MDAGLRDYFLLLGAHGTRLVVLRNNEGVKAAGALGEPGVGQHYLELP